MVFRRWTVWGEKLIHNVDNRLLILQSRLLDERGVNSGRGDAGQL